MLRLWNNRTVRPYLLFGLTVAVFSLIGGTKVLSLTTVYSVFQHFATLGPVALALGLARNFDLSVAGVVGLAGCVAVLVSGYMSLNGPKEGPTWKSGPPIVDYAAGLAAAYAVSAALLQRHRSGEGQYIDVSLLDANLTLMASVLTQCANGGIDPQPAGNEAGNGDPCSTVYDTSDGKLAIGLNEEHQAQALLRHLGGETLACEPRFATDGERRKYQMELRATIQSRLRIQDASRWEDELNAIGVPAARVRSVPEAMGEEQFAARGFMHLFAADQSGVGKAVAVPLAPFRYAHSGPGVVRPPKAVGADNDAILKELGYTEESIQSLRQGGII